MISVGEFYSVMTAVVPLYVAMILAYGSVRWWKILTPDQCGGINRFVAIFAVPLLSFQIISGNNPYEMSGRFILADALQKIAVLGVVGIWARYSRWGSLDWMITLFMLATLPNTLVMGVPLLTAMYGKGPAKLVVQAVVLQCILWYTFLLFLFEYRAAKLLISQKFPTSAKSIASVKVDPEIVSLDYREGLTAEAHFREDGKICVQFKKSPTPSNLTPISTPQPSDLSNVEIYSIQSSSDRTEYFNKIVSDSLQSSNAHTPQEATSPLVHITPNVEDKFRHLVCSRTFSNNAVQIVSNTESDSKELQMFVWSASTSPRSPGVAPPKTTDDKEEKSSTEQRSWFGKDGDDPGMPSTAVMTKLILDMVWRKLIRNPNTYSSLIGLVWALISFRWRLQMPKIIEKSIRILSDAGLGVAMFSLGLFMALQPKLLACGTSMTIIGMAIRFVTSPAVMSATSIAAGLRNVELKAAIIQAALPQGIVPFVFAKEYNVHPDILSTAVIFGMLVSLPITLVYYILLGL